MSLFNKKFLILTILTLVMGIGTITNAALTLEALTITSNGALNLNSAATSDITIGSTLTTGKVILGGTLQMGANDITSTGSLGTTGARLTKGWFTDLEVTNPITGSITGSAATLTTARTINGVSFNGSANITIPSDITPGASGNVLTSNGTVWTSAAPTAASGTVTSASVVSANGFAGTVATATTTPAITLTTSITGLLKGNGTAISAATSGTDYSLGTSLLATGILKSTTTTGALTIAVAEDFPTLNQNTTGSAATLTTARAIYGNDFNGSAALTGIIASTYGGTGNGFTKFTGPTTSEKTFTLPDASATIATIDATQTLTNKRTNPRIVSAASYTTDTGTSLDVSTADQFIITAQAGALLFNAPGGTPVEGQKLIIRIKDNGTARALTYNAVFRAMGVALPSTTVISKTLYMGFIYNSTDTKWDLVAVAQES